MSTPIHKVHVALNTDQLDASIAFYRVFLGTEPVKRKPGYAKFDLDDPALNLTLNEVSTATGAGALNHLGLQVGSTAVVDAAQARLEATGLVTLGERDTDCCYALQDKIWISDPNGYRWEIFVVKQADTRPDLEQAIGDPSVANQASESANDACCAPTCCGG